VSLLAVPRTAPGCAKASLDRYQVFKKFADSLTGKFCGPAALCAKLSAGRLRFGFLGTLCALHVFLVIQSSGRHVGSPAPEMKGNSKAWVSNSQEPCQEGTRCDAGEQDVPPLTGLAFRGVTISPPIPWRATICPPFRTFGNMQIQRSRYRESRVEDSAPPGTNLKLAGEHL
jgi:hypothetical protein